MGIGNRIAKNIKRADAAVVAKLKEHPVANIGDCMNRNAAVSSKFKSSNNKVMAGSALTINTPAGDNLMVYIALDQAKEGDILVINSDGYENRAILGEIITRIAISRGVKGIIVEGAVRDIDELGQLEIPVYYTAVSPNGPYKNGPGEINSPVTIGGKIINPGDIVIGDGDGIVAIKPEEVESVLTKLEEVKSYEASLMKKISAGEKIEFTWAYEKLKQLETEIIE